MHSWRMWKFPRRGIIFSIGVACFSLAACAILFPDRTAPKSGEYKITAPDSPWEKVATGEEGAATDSLKADMAYENPETGAIISLNSICRKYTDSTLQSLTNNLVRGIQNRRVIDQKIVQIDSTPGEDTTFEGVVDNVKINLRTVVLKKDTCTYDFIYVVIPQRERNDRAEFEKFVASFQTED